MSDKCVICNIVSASALVLLITLMLHFSMKLLHIIREYYLSFYTNSHQQEDRISIETLPKYEPRFSIETLPSYDNSFPIEFIQNN